jgi:uncharacterized cupredoxin-like copper-binding protein
MFTKTRLMLLVVAVGLFVMPLLVACGSQGPISADLTDNGIKLASTTAKAGPVTFQIKNDSADEVHELVVLRTDLPADKLSLDAPGGVDEEKFDSAGEQGDIAASQSAKLTLNLTPGHYALICNQPGHYAAGMHLDFTVN